MDFGFRASLWGEEILATQLIKLSYEGTVPQENISADEDSRRFYLKNIAPVFRGDYAHIPLRRFPGYFRSSGDLVASWDEFSAAREWVKTNRYRFVSDARTITERWENPGEVSVPSEHGSFQAANNVQENLAESADSNSSITDTEEK
jgi:hypothetical protein